MISKDNSQNIIENQTVLQRKVEKILLGNNDDDDNDKDDDGGGGGGLGAIYTNSQSTSNKEIVTMIILRNQKGNL